MVTGFNHSGFVVKDLEKMVRFYTELLGMEVVREAESFAPPEGDHTGIDGAHRKLVFLGKQGDKHLLELVHFVDPPSPEGHLERYQLGGAHVCLEVDDLTALYERLTAEDIKFVTPPKFTERPDGGRNGVCYAADPEGNYLELAEIGPP